MASAAGGFGFCCSASLNQRKKTHTHTRGGGALGDCVSQRLDRGRITVSHVNVRHVTCWASVFSRRASSPNGNQTGVAMKSVTLVFFLFFFFMKMILHRGGGDAASGGEWCALAIALCMEVIAFLCNWGLVRGAWTCDREEVGHVTLNRKWIVSLYVLILTR